MDTPVVVDIINTYIITSASEKEKIVKSLDNPKPKPFRLTMFRIVDNCQFCQNPKGDVFCHYVCIDERYGFLSCTDCKKVAAEAIIDWNNTAAYGRANKFKNMKLKIRRSSGTIECDWTLNKNIPLVNYINYEECVHCINEDNTVSKWVRVDELLEMNKN